MDEFNYLQYLNDDDQLLLAENHLVRESFPTFSIVCDDLLPLFLYHLLKKLRVIPSPGKTNEVNTTTPPEPTDEVDVSRFPFVSSDEIQELKSVGVNKSTSRSTKQWMNVFQSWAKSRHLENFSIETIPPEGLIDLLLILFIITFSG